MRLLFVFAFVSLSTILAENSFLNQIKLSLLLYSRSHSIHLFTGVFFIDERLNVEHQSSFHCGPASIEDHWGAKYSILFNFKLLETANWMMRYCCVVAIRNQWIFSPLLNATKNKEE